MAQAVASSRACTWAFAAVGTGPNAESNNPTWPDGSTAHQWNSSPQRGCVKVMGSAYGGTAPTCAAPGPTCCTPLSILVPQASGEPFSNDERPADSSAAISQFSRKPPNLLQLRSATAPQDLCQNRVLMSIACAIAGCGVCFIIQLWTYLMRDSRSIPSGSRSTTMCVVAWQEPRVHRWWPSGSSGLAGVPNQARRGGRKRSRPAGAASRSIRLTGTRS